MRRSRFWQIVVMLCVLAWCAGNALAQNQLTPIPLAKDQLIAFLGDSITQQNLYTRDVELLLNTKYPDLNLHFVNVGWSGRHAAHLMDDAVLNRDLLRLKPDVVLIMFGMNDGWYRTPPSSAAMAAYQSNMDNLVSKIQTALPKTQVVLMTPTPCEPVTSGYLKGYDDTLGQMADYVSTLATRCNLPLIDLFKPMLQTAVAAKATTPTFTMWIDSIHPDPVGHWVIASLVGAAFGVTPGLQVRAEIDAPTATVVSQTQTTLADVSKQQDALTFTQVLPQVPVALPLEARAASNLAPVQATRDHAILVVDKLIPERTYGVYINGQLLGRYLGSELAAGVDWTAARREDPLTDRVLDLALLKYQYRYTAWRAPGTGLAEISPEVANSEQWRTLDAALTALTDQADAQEHAAIDSAKVLRWRIVPETAVPLKKWEINGPYNYQSFAVAYPPETGNAPDAWTVMPAPGDFLDFGPTYGQQYRNSVLFARARIFVPHDAQLSLSAGSDGSVKVWVNGTPCIAHDVFRTAQPGQDAGTAALQPGWNTILARENRGNNGWGLYLQAFVSGLSDDDLKLVKTSPE